MSAARFRVVVVDDELLARRRLRQLLAGAPDFDVVGECGDPREALDVVIELRPDIVFLDIRMPNADGFDVQAELRHRVSRVVFVTAHPEHAARAFDVAAVDYLVKPVTQARFNDALDRLRRGAVPRGGERLLLGSRLGGATAPVADIVWLEAQGAYVTVHLASGQRHVVRESLNQLMDRLGRAHFARVHRSTGVNLAHVRKLKRRDGGLAVELSTGVCLSVSRRKASELVELLRRPPSTTWVDPPPPAVRNKK